MINSDRSDKPGDISIIPVKADESSIHEMDVSVLETPRQGVGKIQLEQA
jgi:hypothetical protein